MSRIYRYALACLIAGCAPYGTSYPSWTQGSAPSQWRQTPSSYDDDSYDADDVDTRTHQAGRSDGDRDDYGGNDGDHAPAQRARRGGGSGAWSCAAEASIGSAVGDGPMTYSVVTGAGNGPTRDAAATQALANCGELVGASSGVSWTYGEKVEGGDCTISRCMGPGGRSR